MSTRALNTQVLHRISTITLVTGALLLAAEPAQWLAGTWHEQGYDGIGWVAFALAAALFTWSLSSPLQANAARHADTSRTLLLLAATAAIRLLAQVLDVNVIGALLLGVDVFALAHLARLPERQRALSPFWLAVLFCFSLPIEPMLQRVFGYLLQQVSAQLACGMLMPIFKNLTCTAVRLQVDGNDVLVDVPCSGAELVSIIGLVFSLINSLRRPSPAAAAIGALICLCLALLGNGMRIALLAAGIANADALPFYVMDPTPHTLIGLTTVGLTSLALLIVCSHLSARLPSRPSSRLFNRLSSHVPNRLPAAVMLSANTRQATALESRPTVLRATGARGTWLRSLYSVSFLAFALLVGAIQPQPVDASPDMSSPGIPRFAAGLFSEEHALTVQEQRYFTRYGGAAARASFGAFGLLLVTTASPLRHLHDPTICLTGMGYAVRLLGTDHGNHSTVYLAERTGVEQGDQSERYTVRVSYRSNSGDLASSIAEVVWLWLKNPTTHWTMVQRVIPHHPAIHSNNAALWESAMRRAFNLS